MLDESMKHVAARIRGLREQNNLSQEEFANRLGILRPTISNWENGKIIPTSEQLIKISLIFGVSIDSMLGLNVYIEKWIIPDTSALLKRPRIVDDLLRKFDRIVISETVISELNSIKDYKGHKMKQSAWLVMASISRCLKESDKVTRKSDVSRKERADDRVIDLAVTEAKAHPNASVCVLSDDVYFSLQEKTVPNLQFLPLSEYGKDPDENLSTFNVKLTQDFFSVVKMKKLDKAKQLESKSVNINAVDPTEGFTPLIQAVRNKDYAMLDFLLSLKKIDLDKKDVKKYEFPPITHAIQMKDMEMVKKLVEAGCDFDAGSDGKNWGNTPLMVAAWHGLTEIVEYLVEEGACLNQQDSNGYTPLIKACIRNNPNVAKILVCGTDTSIRSRDGKTAQDYASGKKGFGEIFSNHLSTERS